MKIVHGDEQPVVSGRNTRAGALNKQYILTGDEGSLGNFVFGLYSQTGDFYSPRHHHNFAQWRYQLEGECNFDKNGVATPGVLTFIPEGAYYGPQTSEGDNLVALIQFGGPSGQGYMSQEQVYAAFEDMKAIGHVDKGVFYRNEGVPGKRAMDSFEAVWEYATGKTMVYPDPPYADPIMINTANFRWMPLAGSYGVEEKPYGTFTDCAFRAASYRLEAGAIFTASGRGIYFVLSGSGRLESGSYRKSTGLLLEADEMAEFRADDTTEVLFMGLPEIAKIRRPLPELAPDREEDLARA
jgi:hypothetical protein